MTEELSLKYDDTALKERGNKLFQIKNFAGAIFLYSAALERVPISNQELRVVLFSNRSAARIKLRLFEDALSDAEMALGLDPFHAKSKFRRGSALMGLGHYDTAHLCFLELDKTGCIESKAKISMMILEGMVPTTVSAAVVEKASSSSCNDSYFGNVQIRLLDDGRGRGLFLTQDVEANDIVLAEKAFCCAFEDECNTSYTAENFAAATGAGLGMKALFRVNSNVLDNSRISALYDGKIPNPIIPPMDLFLHTPNESNETQLVRSNNASNADVLNLQEILPRVVTNAFATKRVRMNQRVEYGTGLWLVASFINHHDVCNCEYSTSDEVWVGRSKVALKAGTELSISYIRKGATSSLKSNWGIDPTSKLAVL